MYKAVRSLAEIGSPAKEALVKVLDSTSPGEAARALGGFADPRLEEPLKRALKSASEKARSEAIKALARISGPTVIPELVAALEDVSPEVR